MSRERFVLISPDRSHALCFEKCNQESGNPGFYMAYPNPFTRQMEERGMDLDEATLVDMITFFHECIDLLKQPGKMGKVIPFRRPQRYQEGHQE